MDILEILKNNKNELIREDIDLFKTELAVGSYSDDYKKKCYEIIDMMESEKKASVNNKVSKAVYVSTVDPMPNPVKTDISFIDQFKNELSAIRLSKTYKTLFRAYIKSHSEINEQFVDSNFNMFNDHETEVIISEISMTEEFLEKYFSALDKEKIAMYQLFSESFYMKHFNDFDAETVIKKGKNPWRKKEERSKQLDIFLRLKGVKF